MSRCENKVDLYEFDSRYRREGLVLAGIDEAGRGPLAGPVVVAAVAFPEGFCGVAVDDSKALNEVQREKLAEELKLVPGLRYAIAERTAAEIDKKNILAATHEGMREVALKIGAGFALVDGLKVPRFPVAVEFLVKGDARSASIAAASILAKTYRDALMVKYDEMYPGYGFAKHKGYGTAEHLEALRRLGPSPIHRLSFRPVREAAGLLPEQLELPL